MHWQRKLGIVLAILVVLALSGVVLWRILLSPPGWYRPPAAEDEEAVALAELVEHRLLEEVHQIRAPDQPWTVRIRDHQVNAWLALRFPQWLARERDVDWPEQLGTPQVRFAPSGITLAVPVTEAGAEQILVMTMLPTIIDGRLHLTLERVGLGRIELPGSPIENISRRLVAALDGGEIELGDGIVLTKLLSGEQSLMPELKLADDRRLHLDTIVLGDGTIDLTARTLPSERADRR